MNDQQRRNQERLVRVRDYVESLAEPFPAASRGAQALAAIKSAIEEAESLDAERVSNTTTAREGTSQRREARASLRSQINVINETARAISIDHPEIKGKFRSAASRLNDQDLLALARSVIAEATPFKQLFLEYDMPADFLEALSAAIERFEEGVNRQNIGAGGRSQTRRGVDDAHRRAEDELDKLNVAMRNRYHKDPATLAAWDNARSKEAQPSSRRNAGQNKAPTTPQT
ncbi:MAG TPA: hypothetical protein VF544_15770 [Pyrinomonadaceae bacterium]